MTSLNFLTVTKSGMAYGIARNIEISIYGEKCLMDFLVIDNELEELVEVIIGIPWFKCMNAGTIVLLSHL